MFTFTPYLASLTCVPCLIIFFALISLSIFQTERETQATPPKRLKSKHSKKPEDRAVVENFSHETPKLKNKNKAVTLGVGS